MRALVIGDRGQLGTEMVRVLRQGPDATVMGMDVPDIDITDSASLGQAFDRCRPDVVVNCAAYTAVDDAETHEDLALAVNGRGPLLIADACRTSGAWLVHLSTDYVFDGTAGSPYSEDAEPAPASAYGRSKLAGDAAVREALADRHYLVRTAWLYGLTGANFAKTMLRLERERDTVSVVTDQVGQPTYARDLAAQIALLLERRPAPGTYHGTNSGEVSWFGFAREVFRLAGADPERVLPTTSAQFVRPAPRPAYSVLGHDRWKEQGIPEMRPWLQALEAAFADGMSAD